jgi:hypothetical protein
MTVTDHVYADLATKQDQLIRKALDGSAFIAPYSADAIANITIDSSDPGTPTLNVLPAGYVDLGLIDDNGAVFSNAVTTSDITSWGRVEPSRRDITADVTTLHIVCQETKLQTIAAFAGVDASTVTPNETTGEVSVSKPSRPTALYYRLFTLAVDQNDSGEIYIATFLPRAQLSDKGDQTYMSGDTAVLWDTTWTAFTDSDLGYAVRYIFGGPGWQALLTDMGLGS